MQLVKGIVVAKYLGPADYGLLKSIELIQMLNKYGSLGFNTALTREAGNAIGNKDNEQGPRLVKRPAQKINKIVNGPGLFTPCCISKFPF